MLIRVGSPAGVAAAWLTATLLFGPATSARAQGFGMGLLGGAIRTEVNVSDDESMNVALEHQSKVTGGLYGILPVSESFWIQPEALLAVKGTQWNLGASAGSLRLTYLDVPVLMRFAGPVGAKVKVHLFAGPTAGFLLNATVETERPTSARTNVQDRFKTVDLGWTVGAGVGGTVWNLDLRYGGSFAGITDEQGLGGGAPAPVLQDVTYRNRAFLLLAGIRLF
jgi:Outer membrane protein beta-barrel domain